MSPRSPRVPVIIQHAGRAPVRRAIAMALDAQRGPARGRRASTRREHTDLAHACQVLLAERIDEPLSLRARWALGGRVAVPRGARVPARDGHQEGDSVILTGEPREKDGKTVQMRMVFRDITRDAFLWTWERGTPGGPEWTPMLVIRYARRSGGVEPKHP